MNLKDFYGRFFPQNQYEAIKPFLKKIKKDLFLPEAWGSTSDVLKNLIDEIKPNSILEIGVWKGTSAVFMTECALKHSSDVTLVCVDTWLSSNALLWRMSKNREKVMASKIEESQYGQFLANILHSGLEKYIYPFRNTSSVVLQLLHEEEVLVDMIYIDAGHLEHEVAIDLLGSWKVLRKKGVLVGDDFTNKFPGVKKAVQAFAKAHKVKLHTKGQKWWMYKS